METKRVKNGRAVAMQPAGESPALTGKGHSRLEDTLLADMRMGHRFLLGLSIPVRVSLVRLQKRGLCEWSRATGFFIPGAVKVVH